MTTSSTVVGRASCGAARVFGCPVLPFRTSQRSPLRWLAFRSTGHPVARNLRLPCPLQGQRLRPGAAKVLRRLPPIPGSPRRCRRPQAEPQYATDVSNSLIFSAAANPTRWSRASVRQHSPPAERPGNRLDHGVVNSSAERRPSMGAPSVRGRASLPAAPVTGS